MKTNEEIMLEFVEMMEQEHKCDEKEMNSADYMNKSYFNGVYQGSSFIVGSDEFQAIKERVESAKNAQCSCLGHRLKCQPNDYPALDELKDKVESNAYPTEECSYCGDIYPNNLIHYCIKAAQDRMAEVKAKKAARPTLLDYINEDGRKFESKSFMGSISDYIEKYLK